MMGRVRFRSRCLAWAVVIVLLGGTWVSAEHVTLDEPVSLGVRLNDEQRTFLKGKAAAYDESGFDLQTEDESVRIAWSQLTPTWVLNVHRRLLREGTAEQWLEAGKRLWAMEGGQRAAEEAFARARRLDADLADRIEKIKLGLPDEPTADDEHPTTAPAEVQSLAPPPVEGPVDHKTWGDRSPERRAQAVEHLKQFADQTQDQLKLKLWHFETDYFLFYTNLNKPEARRWAKLLDKMYDRLCKLFAVEEGTNIWHGKALVLVFARGADYRRFQMQIHETNPGDSVGMCHCFGDGTVHIAFHRPRDQWVFAHVLVHESVHGFLHRYRSPAVVPSWINEGLAESIAQELAPKSHQVELKELAAKRLLHSVRRIDPVNFFEARHIPGDSYGIASGLTKYMLKQDKKRYAAFINGIKEGLDWRESLAEKYGVELERLVHFYGRSINIRDLKLGPWEDQPEDGR